MRNFIELLSKPFLLSSLIFIQLQSAWAAPVPSSVKKVGKLVCTCERFGQKLMHPDVTFGSSYKDEKGQMLTRMLRPELPAGFSVCTIR